MRRMKNLADDDAFTRNGGAATRGRRNGAPAAAAQVPGRILETVVSPFHCLYQDALEFHTQSRLRLAVSEAEASRLARAALLMYLESGSALVHQAAVELGRSDLARLVADPSRPLSPADAWRILPALAAENPGATGRLPLTPSGFDPESPPWPQFAELLALRASWSHPGPPSSRRAYYHSSGGTEPFEPLQPHRIPASLGIDADDLRFPLTGLPRDPYALRPTHLDTARAVLDAAIEALDRRLGGALTRDGRHRREPVRMVYSSGDPLPGERGA